MIGLLFSPKQTPDRPTPAGSGRAKGSPYPEKTRHHWLGLTDLERMGQLTGPSSGLRGPQFKHGPNAGRGCLQTVLRQHPPHPDYS